MTTFQTFTDLPEAERAEYDRIAAIDSGLRNSVEAAFFAARAGYVDNEIVIEDADGNIVFAQGNTLPTGYAGFSKSALFIKKDVAAGTKALYENSGDTTTAAWGLIGATSTAEITDLAVTAAKLAATLDLNGKVLGIPSGTPVNAVGSTGTLTLDGDVTEGEIITINGRVYEIDSDGSVGAGHVAVDVSGGATAAEATLTISNPVSDGETITINDRVYELDADDTSTGDVAVDISAGTKAQAAETLTLTDVVVAGETFIVGEETFEFGGGQAISGSNIEIDITSGMIASQGTLTLGGAIPANNEAMTVGTQTYTWKTALTGAADEIKRGLTVDDCIDNFVAAINAAAGAGTTYGTGTVANADVSAVKSSGTAAILTARVAGVVGDAIATTETMADEANVFDAVTLGTTTAGADCAAADADGLIISGFNAGTALAITATQGAGTSVVFTADAAGALDGSLGNAVVTDEDTMANATFGSGHLADGSDATAAEAATAIIGAITADTGAEVTAATGGAGVVTVTAIPEGTIANGWVTAETLANGSWGGNLAGGTDEGQANAVTAIALAITNDASAVVTAVDGAGDTVVLTAKVKGVVGDAITTTTDLANGAFAAGTLGSGVNGTVGAARQVLVDSSYLYFAIAVNTIADANWRRIALGSAF